MSRPSSRPGPGLVGRSLLGVGLALGVGLCQGALLRGGDSPAPVPVRPGAPAPPSCEAARRNNRWCAAGNVGYVAAVEIRSRFLFEALDAHGHDIDPAAVTCETCRKALRTHGFCAAHRMGYVGGHAFMSPITYYLARSRRIDPDALTCPVCRRHTRGIGWCDKDRVGIVGTFALDDRQEFDEMQKAYGVLRAAVDMSSNCERCAAACRSVRRRLAPPGTRGV